jgi:hypothetical protein
MKSSKFFALNWKDFFKGLLVAVISAIITTLYELVQTGDFLNVGTLKKVGLVALSAFLAYLIKNLFTNSSNEPLKSENS